MKTCLIVLAVGLLLIAVVAMFAAIAFLLMARRKRQSSSGISSGDERHNAVPTAPANAATVAVPLQTRGSFVFLSGPLSGRRYDVTPAGLWIGRDDTANLVLSAASVSKKHAWVGVRHGSAVVVDEGSTNGTFVGERSGPRVTEHLLEDGETIVIADDVARFRFER